MDAELTQQPMRRRDIRRAEEQAKRRARLGFPSRSQSAHPSADSVPSVRRTATAPAAAVARGSDGSRLRAYRLRRRLAGSSIAVVAGVGVIGGGFALLHSSLGDKQYANAQALSDTPQGPQQEAIDSSNAGGGSSKSGQQSTLSGGVLGSEGDEANAAARAIEKTALPGCDGKAPASTATNGKLPDSWMCELGIGQHKLRADAAVAFAQMNAAYKEDTGKDMAVTDSYRSYESQLSVAARKPSLAAKPGTSMHGWGIAIDFGDGAPTASGELYNWLVANAGEYGWENPDWAKGKKYEPWHWEYVPARKMIKGS